MLVPTSLTHGRPDPAGPSGRTGSAGHGARRAWRGAAVAAAVASAVVLGAACGGGGTPVATGRAGTSGGSVPGSVPGSGAGTPGAAAPTGSTPTSVTAPSAGPRPTTVGPPVAATSSEARGVPRNGSLPTLPPIAARHPGAAGTDGGREVDAQDAGASADDWRNLSGFTGRGFTTDRRSGAPVVLPESVVAGTGGTWSAQGLVRNESGVVIARLGVVAELLGADGSVLERVETVSPVSNVRIGEPVPFSMRGQTPASMVASVRWASASAAGSDESTLAAAASSRAFEVWTLWTRPVGGRPVDNALHRDGAAGPAAHLVFGSVANVGPATGAVRVVAAWVDDSGRVVAVADAGVVDADDAVVAAFPAEGLGNAMLVVEAPAAAAVASLTPMLWVVGA